MATIQHLLENSVRIYIDDDTEDPGALRASVGERDLQPDDELTIGYRVAPAVVSVVFRTSTVPHAVSHDETQWQQGDLEHVFSHPFSASEAAAEVIQLSVSAGPAPTESETAKPKRKTLPIRLMPIDRMPG